jgi:hypothetical protein
MQLPGGTGSDAFQSNATRWTWIWNSELTRIESVSVFLPSPRTRNDSLCARYPHLAVDLRGEPPIWPGHFVGVLQISVGTSPEAGGFFVRPPSFHVHLLRHQRTASPATDEPPRFKPWRFALLPCSLFICVTVTTPSAHLSWAALPPCMQASVTGSSSSSTSWVLELTRGFMLAARSPDQRWLRSRFASHVSACFSLFSLTEHYWISRNQPAFPPAEPAQRVSSTAQSPQASLQRRFPRQVCPCRKRIKYHRF